MHIPALFPIVLLALTFIPVWFWPRYWLAALLTVGWMGVAFMTHPSASAFVRIAVIGAVVFAIVAWRRRRKAPVN